MMNKIKQFTEDIVTGASILANHGVGEWKKFLADKKAQTGTIMAIVTGSITVLLGVIIFVNVKTLFKSFEELACGGTTCHACGERQHGKRHDELSGFDILFSGRFGRDRFFSPSSCVYFSGSRATPGRGRRLILSPLYFSDITQQTK